MAGMLGSALIFGQKSVTVFRESGAAPNSFLVLAASSSKVLVSADRSDLPRGPFQSLAASACTKKAASAGTNCSSVGSGAAGFAEAARSVGQMARIAIRIAGRSEAARFQGF